MATWRERVSALAREVGLVIGDLSALVTTDKTSLVAAINEVAEGGGTGGSGGVNLLPDGSFEAGVDSWVAGTGVVLSSSTAATPLDGAKALLFTCAGGRPNSGSTWDDYATATREITGLVVGTLYEFSVSGQPRTGAAPNISIAVADSSGLVHGAGLLDGSEAPGEWKRAVPVRFYATEQTMTLVIFEVIGDAMTFALDSAVVMQASDYGPDIDDIYVDLDDMNGEMDAKAPLVEPEFTGPVVVTTVADADHGTASITAADVTQELALTGNAAAAGGDTFKRARGTLASKSAVGDNDTLAYLGYVEGHDGTDYQQAAQVTVEVDGTVAAGKVPGRVVVSTADADGLVTERVRFSADGTTDISGSLTVNGSPVSGGGASALDDLSDVNLAGAVNGDYLRRVSGVWVPAPKPGILRIASDSASSVSSYSLDDVFDAALSDHYVIELTNIIGSTYAEVGVRLRDSGTDLAGSGYYARRLLTRLNDGSGAGDVADNNNLGTDEWSAGLLDNTYHSSLKFELWSPAKSGARTQFKSQIIAWINGAHWFGGSTGENSSTSAYDGCTITPTSGTFSFDITVDCVPK